MPLCPLPIDDLLPQITASLRAAPNLVLVAPPGAGKTTRVPPAVLAARLLAAPHDRLVMLQPRRVAARAAAARIADEQGWALGREVGYQVRFENRTSAATRLVVVTEGILTRRLQADPYLDGVGVVVLDEFHERSLHSDLAIALLRDLQRHARPELRIVVMSATLDAEPIAAFLGEAGTPAPILRSLGRPHPVEIAFQDRPAPLLGPRTIAEPVTAALRAALSAEEPDGGEPGDVLVFLPGVGEINRCLDAAGPLADRHDLDLLPLHGSLTADEQDRALRRGSRRRVVFATNIAETSITLDGVTSVVDSGLARVLRCDPRLGIDRLELGRISKSSATQRSGRAGRQRPGRCWRLWTRHEDAQLPESEKPEVLRVDLAGTVLALAEWGVRDPGAFGWFEAPPPALLDNARTVLAMLGAIEQDGRITARGREMLGLPLHPRLARLMLAGVQLGFAEQAATFAALLSEKDMADAAPPANGGVECDLAARADLLDRAEQRRFAGSLRDEGLDVSACRSVARARDQLLSLLPRGGSQRGTTPPQVGLLLAYPDRVARRRSPHEPRGVMVGGRGVVLDAASRVHHAELFLALDLQDIRTAGKLESRANLASAIEPAWLERYFPGNVGERTTVRFDSQREAVTATRCRCYRDLPLEEARACPPDAEQAGAVLAEELGRDLPRFFATDESADGWLRRLAFLRGAMPELDWPTLDDAALRRVLASACAGQTSVAGVRGVPLVPLLEAELTGPQRRALSEHAPAVLEVPSGSRIRVEYHEHKAPVLAVRLQEVFGWRQTPRLAGGRVPVTLHLLGPNFRPVQITADLASFWANGYAQVRKDLRARYPRHSWPDDPLTARPEAKGGRRRA